MANVIVFNAVILLLSAATTVSAFRTIVTVTVDDGAFSNRNYKVVEQIQSDSCNTQIKKQELYHCERFLNVTAIKEQPRRKDELLKCCQQVSEVEPECQCEALFKVVADINREEKHDPEELEVMKDLERIVLGECELARCGSPRVPMRQQVLRSTKTYRF